MEKLEDILDELECCCSEHTCGKSTTEERWKKMNDIMCESGFEKQELIDGWSERETNRKNRANKQSP